MTDVIDFHIYPDMYFILVEKKGLICRRYVSDILQEITRIREKVGDLLSYDWISVPLVYSQVIYIFDINDEDLVCLLM